LLALLEKKLHAAVRDVIDDAVPVVPGPAAEPATNVKEVVQVSVCEFKAAIPPTNEEILTARGRARTSHRHVWDANGKKSNFTLPENIPGEVVEVEAPPGHSVTLGDDCFVENRTLCFYHPPAKGKPGVKAVLQGNPAKGYRETRPCRIAVNLTVRAGKINDADALFTRSLNALLAAFVNMDTLYSPEDESGVNMRLLKPAALPDLIERSSHKAGSTHFYRVTAGIALLGELEVSVALGAEEPQAVIEKIQYETQPVKKAAEK